MEQRSDEWFAIRCGKVTASAIKDVMSKTKTGETAGRRNYRAQLIAERLTGVVQETYTNSAMLWGIEQEDKARCAYEFSTGQTVKQKGFIIHETIDMAGMSPDGLVGDKGLVEIKCPNTANHIDYMTSDEVPKQYVKQMQWQMACSGREWNDFVSYDPRMPVELQLFIKRLERDDKMIKDMEDAVTLFLSEVDATIEKLNELAK